MSRRIDQEPLHFRRADALGAGIGNAFGHERRKIQSLLPTAEVLHTGATSVPGALTRGDLDIHVRVPTDDFDTARVVLSRAYAAYRGERWTNGFATFVAPHASVPTGVALTTIGSEHDRRFLVGWDRLRSRPELLAEYNELKLKHEGALDATTYEAEKSTFFSALVARDETAR